ncbi:MAG: GPR endopeptidase [Bacillota bacterium]|nr:GPR endopeptidase [Bacillota bacterium]
MLNNSTIKTDLAVEARELATAASGEINGVESEESKIHGFTVSRMKIVNEDGERAMGKRMGKYVTVELPREYRFDFDMFKNAVTVIGHEISQMLNLGEKESALVVGLGNAALTADALGPMAIKATLVTRHVKEEKGFENLRPVSALAPGVMGQTGVETAEVIKGLVERISPSVLIVIDALSARRLSRLATTIQISDTGIHPGSGVDNARSEISKDTIGIPVVCVGMPTVVNAATMAADVIELVSDEMKKGTAGNDTVFRYLNELDRNQLYTMSIETLAPYDLNLFVTPKDIDDIVLSSSRLMGYSINAALQKDITVEEMMQALA